MSNNPRLNKQINTFQNHETGTNYNINRDYNPVTGRYIQSDPIGFDGGVNGYLYAEGKPIKYFDAMGLQTNFKFGEGAIVLGEGSVGVFGQYDDWNYATGQQRTGTFIASGDAWGVDVGLSGGSGVIWGNDSYDKFMGWSKTWTLGFFLSGGYIEDMNGNNIGWLYDVGIRFGLTYAVTYTYSIAETEVWR